MIPARADVITLGARDVRRLAGFYRGLGWDAVGEVDDFVAFGLRGAVLSLFPLDKLAADGNAHAAAPERGMRGFTIAITLETPEAVDETIEAVRRSGGRVTKEPVDTDFGGRSAYFADPEDNYWEVVWVPLDSAMVQAIRRAHGER